MECEKPLLSTVSEGDFLKCPFWIWDIIKIVDKKTEVYYINMIKINEGNKLIWVF